MKKTLVVHLPEPELEFRYGQRAAYPRDGLYLFGPVDSALEPRRIRYGVIGTSVGVERFSKWARQVSRFIDIPQPGRTSKAVQPHHVAFPGFNEAFFASWSTGPVREICDISEAGLKESLLIANRYEAVKAAVDVYVDRLIADRKRNEDPPHFWYVIIPEFVYELGRPLSKVSHANQVQGQIKISLQDAARLSVQPTLFGEAEKEAEVYEYKKDFRRQLKARLLDHQIVTQIIRETTIAPTDFLKSNMRDVKRRVEDPATIAWKLCTTSYYKSGGRPWQLADVRPSVCYVGLVYKRMPFQNDSRHACCAAQMFLSSGEGVVFRGALGPWYQPDRKQFHLDYEAAARLVTTVLEEYRQQHDGYPLELFIHAKSSFSDSEWQGFVQSSKSTGTKVVGVQIVDAWDQLKLYRPGNYPTVRGTAMVTSETSAFLWTSGFVPRLDTYMGPETPNPLRVSVRRGEADIRTVMSDVLSLTKINFNTCLFNDREPVTIRFADAIGDILVSAPVQSEPKLPFKYYI